MPHVDGVHHRFVDVAGVRIHVAEIGEGPPLLLVHGWPQHWFCWRRLVPLLEGFRLVMPDMRGFGWSGVPSGGYSKQVLADDVLAVMDAVDVEQAGLVGHDWGGWIGFLACLREPDRFTALLAVSTLHPFVRFDVRTIARSWRFGYQAFIGSPLGRVALRRPELVDRMLRADTDAIDDPGMYSSVIAQRGRAWASEQLYQTFLLHEVPRLHRHRDGYLQVPTLLVVGDRDPVIRPAMLGGFQPYAAEMSVEILERVGHFVPEAAPVELATIAHRHFDTP